MADRERAIDRFLRHFNMIIIEVKVKVAVEVRSELRRVAHCIGLAAIQSRI